MTVQIAEVAVVHKGNAKARTFSFKPLVATSADDFKVTKRAADGTETVLVRENTATGYAMVPTVFPAIGDITYPAVGGTLLAYGEKLAIQYNIAFLQSTDYTQRQAYVADTIERHLDRLCIYDLMIGEKLSRAVRVSTGADQSTPNVEIPGPGELKYLRWSWDGLALEFANAGGLTGDTRMKVFNRPGDYFYAMPKGVVSFTAILIPGGSGGGKAAITGAGQCAHGAAGFSGAPVIVTVNGTKLGTEYSGATYRIHVGAGGRGATAAVARGTGEASTIALAGAGTVILTSGRPDDLGLDLNGAVDAITNGVPEGAPSVAEGGQAFNGTFADGEGFVYSGDPEAVSYFKSKAIARRGLRLSTTETRGGTAANTPFCTGGRGGAPGNGRKGTGYGAGGGGGSNPASTASVAEGGTGTGGAVIILERFK